MSRVGRLLLILLLVGSTPAFAQTNTWTEHPNTSFEAFAVASGIRAEHDRCNPSSGVGAILGAWVAGAYHEGLKRFLVYRGGGHADGCWNGGASFDPEVKTWARLTTSSPTAPKMSSTDGGDANFLVKYPDGSPSSVHSYGTQFCIKGGPFDGKCPTSGGIYWSHAGKSVPETPFLYDPSKPDAVSAYTEKKTRPGGYGTIMAWNATRQRAFMAGSAGAFEWDPVADVYTQLFSTQGAGTSSSIAIDDAAGRVYLLFGGTPVGSRLKYVDYATAPTTKYQSITTTGGDGLENLAAPGFLFTGRDSANRVRLVGLGKKTVTIPPVPPSTTPVTGERAAIFTLLDDGVCGRGPATPCVWTAITATNPTSNLPPKPFVNGMWNKFFAHRCDLYAIVTAGSQNATQLPPSGDKGNVWSFRPDFTLPNCLPPDTTPPQVVIINPALDGNGNPQVYSGIITLNYLANDNVGVVTLIATVDGITISGSTVDTRGLPNGSYHTLVVRAIDAAGNSGQASVVFMVFNCPVCPPPPQAFTLTLAKTGTGDGTVSGPSSVLEGATVTIQSAPDANSVGGAWSPAPCAEPTFTMPAQNLTCVKEFTLKPPPADPLPPANTWRSVPDIPATMTTQTVRIGKHFRAFVDSKRGNNYVVVGGDRVADPYNPSGEQSSDAGNPAITVVDRATGLSSVLSPMCPAAPLVMPSFPDNTVWTNDTTRDVWRLYRGFWFGQITSTGSSQTKSVCGRDPWPQSPTFDPNVLFKDLTFTPATNLWALGSLPSPYGFGSDNSGPSQGLYDAVTDASYMGKSDGAWGGVLLIHRHATDTWQVVKLGEHHPSGSEQRGLLRNSNIYRNQLAILDGKLYVMSNLANKTDATGKVTIGSALLEIDLTNPDSMEGQVAYRFPSDFVPPAGQPGLSGCGECYLVAFPKQHVVVMPAGPSDGGLTDTITSLFPFDTVTKQWLPTRPVPVPPAIKELVKNGYWLYDPVTEEMVTLARRLPGFRGYLSWRYRFVK